MAQDPGQVIHENARERTTPPESSSATAEEIRLQIKETRAEMADTIDAIQARLSPSGLIARAKETVRDVTVGRVKGLAQRAMPAVGEGRGECFWITPRLIQAVKENPLPVALIGLAATVLMVRTLRMGRAAQ